MKTKAQKQVEAWLSIFNQFAAETGGFSADLSTLEDSELISIKRVTRPFLDLAPRMLEIVRPQHRAELRRAIAYLADLAERQNAAIERETARFEQRQRDFNIVCKALHNVNMSNAEKLTLARLHYGWE